MAFYIKLFVHFYLSCYVCVFTLLLSSMTFHDLFGININERKTFVLFRSLFVYIRYILIYFFSCLYDHDTIICVVHSCFTVILFLILKNSVSRGFSCFVGYIGHVGKMSVSGY